MPGKLGRIARVRILDEHRFRHLYFSDGTHRVVAHLSAHYDAPVGAAPPPDMVNWYTKADAGLAQMDDNDTLGDCVIACGNHIVNVWTGNNGQIVLATDSETKSDYVNACGAGDNGCNIIDVLDYWKSTGLAMSGKRHKISQYVSVNNTNKTLVQVAIQLFGGLKIGFNLPKSWYNNANPGFIWDNVPRGFAVEGGHCVAICGFNSTGVQVATWGVVGTITWAALANTQIVDECYAPLGVDWTVSGGLAPNGIDAATLSGDLALIQNGQIPDPSPTPLPPPTPVPPPNPNPPPTPNPVPVPGTGPYPVWALPPGVYYSESGTTPALSGSVLTVTETGKR